MAYTATNWGTPLRGVQRDELSVLDERRLSICAVDHDMLHLGMACGTGDMIIMVFAAESTPCGSSHSRLIAKQHLKSHATLSTLLSIKLQVHWDPGRPSCEPYKAFCVSSGLARALRLGKRLFRHYWV